MLNWHVGLSITFIFISLCLCKSVEIEDKKVISRSTSQHRQVTNHGEWLIDCTEPPGWIPPEQDGWEKNNQTKIWSIIGSGGRQRTSWGSKKNSDKGLGDHYGFYHLKGRGLNRITPIHLPCKLLIMVRWGAPRSLSKLKRDTGNIFQCFTALGPFPLPHPSYLTCLLTQGGNL